MILKPIIVFCLLSLAIAGVVYAQEMQQQSTPLQQALDRYMRCQVDNVNHQSAQAQEYFKELQRLQAEVAALKQPKPVMGTPDEKK